MVKMDFSEALFLLKAGKRVRRESWESRYAFMTIEGETPRPYMTFDSGLQTQFEINATMIIAEDWQEVEGEKA